MRKLLGPHLAGQWTSRIETVRKWQPPLILLLQPQVDKVHQLRAACPGAIIVGRFYHDDSHYASNINSRPKEFAHEIHNEIVNNPVTPLLDFVQSNNETNQDWQGIQKLNVFTQEWMHLADQSGTYKCAILAFSVGNPDMPYKPGDPSGFDGKMLYWQQVLPSLNYAQANDHILLLHAYGYPDMFHPAADWYIYRYERQVQANLKTLGITHLKYAYGEIGIDRYITGEKGGYKSVPTTDQDYTNQLLQWERDQQGQSRLLGGAIFTAGDSGGWDSYDIFSTQVADMIAQHYVDHAGDYDAVGQDDTSPEGNKPMAEVHIPAVSTGTKPQAPALPPVEYDPRLKERGVHIDVTGTHDLAPGTKYWRVAKVQWYDEQQAQGRHHIYVEALDEDGNPTEIGFKVFWPGDMDYGDTNKRSGFDAGNFPMSASRNEFGVAIDSSAPSEAVTGIGMGADTPGGFNAGIHTSTGVVFQLATMPATQPAPQPQQPQTPVQPGQGVTMYVDATAGANLRQAPHIHAEIIATVPYGEPVATHDDTVTDGWMPVTYQGKSGFIFAPLLSATPPAGAPPAPTPAPKDNCWERALAFVLEHEGGYADDPNDPGGATMRGITIATYTKWLREHGRSAPSKEELRNITNNEVREIYFHWYWAASGADKLAWPLCLVQMDTAVNAGVGRAQEMLQKSNGDFLAYMGHLIEFYARIDGFQYFGKAWMLRRADLLLEASK